MTTPQQPQSKDWEREFDEKFAYLKSFPVSPDPECTVSIYEEFRDYAHTLLSEERSRIGEQILGLKREFWEDEDHAVGGYISKKDIKALLESNETTT